MIAANESTDDGNAEKGSTQATGSPAKRHVLRVDHSERHATLLDLARTCADFDVRMERLDIGDYCIDADTLMQVRGVGRKKAARIRELVR
jgi:ERCC4-type nuclease